MSQYSSKAYSHYAECLNLAIMLSVTILNVVAPSNCVTCSYISFEVEDERASLFRAIHLFKKIQ